MSKKSRLPLIGGLIALVCAACVLFVVGLSVLGSPSAPAPPDEKGAVADRATPPATPRPTVTLAPTRTPTLAELLAAATPEPPIATPEPADTPTPESPATEPPAAEAVVATDTPEPANPALTPKEGTINLRGGPGTGYEIVGSLDPGQSLEIVGRNTDSSWWQVSLPDGSPAWVAGEVALAENITDDIPVVEAPALPTPEPPTPTAPVAPAAPPTNTPVPAPPTQPTAAPAAACECGSDTYNCPELETHARAQACFDYCVSQGRGDIHRLDADDDEIACESLP